MSESLRDASVAEIRSVMSKSLKPEQLRVVRQHDGGMVVSILSKSFSETQDPRDMIERILAAQGLRLPRRTLTILKSPDELEEGEYELFCIPSGGTPTWADTLLVTVHRLRPEEQPEHWS